MAPLNFEELRDVLDLSLRAGRLMLENGANTARVEETIERLGNALGAEEMDVFVTPTGIIATDASGTEHRTRLVRIHHTGIDLNKTASVLELTARVVDGQLDRAGVAAELQAISGQKRVYGLALTTVWLALACACFAMLFGGGPREVAATAVAAGGAHALRAILGRINLGRMVSTFLTAVLASWAGLVLARVIGAPLPEVALLSPALLLVPGVLMVSSVSDLFRGDTISGLARAMQAFLVTATIGAGLWTTTLLSKSQLVPLGAPLLPLPLAFPIAFIAAAGFAVLFDVPRKALMLAGAVGAFAFAARSIIQGFGLPNEVAMFTGGLVCAVLAQPLSRLLKLPTSIFTIPGFIPLVPGISAFHTLLELANGDYAAGTAGLVRVSILVGSLAAGIGVINALTPLRRNGPE